MTGDPLQQDVVVARLRREGLMDSEGFAPAQAWLEQSFDTRNPDALTRLHHAFYGQDILNKASVIVATKPGRASTGTR